ncbi:MAG: hypothetical protein ABIP49_04690, partial [Lysobacterales bacterium]
MTFSLARAEFAFVPSFPPGPDFCFQVSGCVRNFEETFNQTRLDGALSAPWILPRRSIQVSMGWRYARIEPVQPSSQRNSQLMFPLVSTRVGLTDWLDMGISMGSVTLLRSSPQYVAVDGVVDARIRLT